MALFLSENMGNMGIISASLITIKPRTEMYHCLNSVPDSFENLIHPRSVHHVYVSDSFRVDSPGFARDSA